MITNYLNRYLEEDVVRRISLLFLFIGMISLIFTFWTVEDGKNIFGSYPGADFSCFYVAGSLLNAYPPQQLYDFALQSELYHKLLPEIPSSVELPFVNPPFFAVLFRPLALIPFFQSYLLWILLSTTLYWSGFELIRRSINCLPQGISKNATLLALSFSPFLFETAIGGNSSAVGFFSVALAVYFDRRHQYILSGIALALCFYKPTFLVLLLPMLVVARRPMTFLGVCLGGGFLSVVSISFVGWESSVGYLSTLINLTQMSSGSEELFRTWKYVDLVSFTRLLFGGTNALSWSLITGFFLLILSALVYFWLKYDPMDEDNRDLLWASTIAWTTVINLHLAVYDSILVIISLLLTAGVLYRRGVENSIVLAGAYKWLLVAVYITPLVSQQMARASGLQVFSLVLIWAAAYPLFFIRPGGKSLASAIHTVDAKMEHRQ